MRDKTAQRPVLPTEAALVDIRTRGLGYHKPHVFTWNGERWVRWRRGPFSYINRVSELRSWGFFA